MSNSGGIISRPVSQRDIQTVLGISSSVNKLSQLCTHANINKWAKYKPIKYAANGIMSQYDFTNECWKSDSTWWKGSGGTCGFTVFTCNSLSDVISNTTGGMNGWGYNGTPTGGTYPYREADFIGYNHNAKHLFANFACNSEIKGGGNFTASCMINMEGSDAIVLSDLNVNGSVLYFGIIITNSSGTILKQVTNQTAGDVGVSITFPTSIGVGNNYRCYPFLAVNPIQLDASVGNNTFYTCPELTYATFNVVSHYQNLDVSYDASYNSGSHTRLHVDITNNESATIYNCKVYILPYTVQNWNNPASAVSQAVGESAYFDLASGFTAVKSFTVIEGSYFAYITLANGAEYRKTNIREDFSPQV